VQGVGFRYTTRNVAHRYAVDGFVKNLTDGAVEVVAQGRGEEVERFLSDIEKTMAGLIRSRTISWEAAGGDLDGFSVSF